MYPYWDPSAGTATPIEDATILFGSFVEFLDMTRNTTCPGCSSLSPSSLETILHPGGRMLETDTRLNFSIPASLSAISKDWSSCLCLPTPLVLNISLGTMAMSRTNCETKFLSHNDSRPQCNGGV